MYTPKGEGNSVYHGICIICLPLGVYFHGIWYIDGWVSIIDLDAPSLQDTVNFAKFDPKKNPIWYKLGVFA